MAETQGINHLGLTVSDLAKSTAFFVYVLGWEESAYDESYPRTKVTDGYLTLTLWQADQNQTIETFDRRKNVGLHHLAIEVASEEKLNRLYQKVLDNVDCYIEFAPEWLSGGPRKHMMLREPSGIRLELIWAGNSD